MRIDVLLVDDEAPFVQTLTKRLSKRDLNITPAHSGEEALEKLAAERSIDVVILDVKMPGMDGIQTLQQIKTRHPLVEVVATRSHLREGRGVETPFVLGPAHHGVQADRTGDRPLEVP